MRPEILLVRDHVEIKLPNGDTYRINAYDKSITINLQSDNGTMLIKPRVSNEVSITSIELDYVL